MYYTVRVICFGLAFSTINITLTTLYSQIIGPRRQVGKTRASNLQGHLHGYFQTTASTAKLTGPLVIGQVYNQTKTFSALYTGFGPRAVWGLQFLVVGVTLSLWIIFFERMVPLIIPKEEKSENGKAKTEEK